MKKTLLWLMIVTVVVSMVAAFSLAGCKTTTTETAAAITTAAETTAAETTAAETTAAGTTAAAGKMLTVGVCIRSTASEYHMQYVAGAQLFVDTLPKGTAQVQILACEANDDKQINDVKALAAKSGKDTILYIDPNNAPNVTAIAQICEDNQIFWTDAWNSPEGIYPVNSDNGTPTYPHWVLFESCDGVKQGYDIAIEMFKSFKTPNEGTILAIDGMLANNAAVDRAAGLAQALKENPGVKLLDEQPADWDTKKALALTETWLAKYPNVDGIWCACDDMAVGVVQALKAKGLNGKIKTTGVDGTSAGIAGVESGDIVCTIANNGWMQAGYGVAYAYAAYTGKIVPKDLPDGKRMFYTNGYLVNKDTLQKYKDTFVTSSPTYDFTNLDFPIARPITVKTD